MGRIKAEYIWMDGHKPTSKLRSKTRIVDSPVKKLEDLPEWGFDGSSMHLQHSSKRPVLVNIIF